MPYFHALALFEVRALSLEEADRAAAGLFHSLRHERLRYYEHETSGGAGASQTTGTGLYFTVFSDFDVEAPTEEKATDLVQEVLEDSSTEDIQYLAHGFSLGNRRVHPRTPVPDEEREARPEEEGREEPAGKRRRPRGRGRGKAGERATEGETEEKPIASSVPLHEEAPVEAEPAISEAPLATTAIPTEKEPEQPASQIEIVETEVPPIPPPRSSTSMRVTLQVTFLASELDRLTNGDGPLDQQTLIDLATTEARRRHPEAPPEITPESVVSLRPGGDTEVSLTWHYEVPMPSAST